MRKIFFTSILFLFVSCYKDSERVVITSKSVCGGKLKHGHYVGIYREPVYYFYRYKRLNGGKSFFDTEFGGLNIGDTITEGYIWQIMIH